MRNIQFLDLKTINHSYKDDFNLAFQRVLKSGWFINGSELESFESEFAKYCGTSYCIGTGNGLDALTLVLKAWIELGFIKKKDEVIIPGNTFIASALSIIHAGLVPVFAEPDPISFNLNVEGIEKARTKNTKVIMPVHLYGQLASMNEICDYAKRNKLLVLEDAAQAHGATFNGSKAGSFGDAAGFSFYPGKNLGAIGDGGAVTTNCEDTAKLVRSIGNYGSQKKYLHVYQGLNSRLDEIQAAFLRIKLANLNDEIKVRQKIAENYDKSISHQNIVLPKIINHEIESHVYHLYVIKNEQRDMLQIHLAENGIETLIHYPIPISNQKSFSAYKNLADSTSMHLSNTILSLPIGSHLNDADIEYICDSINRFS